MIAQPIIVNNTIRIERINIISVYLFLKTECFVKYREIISITKVVLIAIKFSKAYQMAKVINIILKKTDFKILEYLTTSFHFEEIKIMSQSE